jgi:hypothetical protein
MTCNGLGDRGSVSGRECEFSPCMTTPRWVVGPTQSPIQLSSGFLSQDVKLMTHFHPVPTLRVDAMSCTRYVYCECSFTCDFMLIEESESSCLSVIISADKVAICSFIDAFLAHFG